jgi:hypothetical protein
MVTQDTPTGNQRFSYYAGMFCITAATLALQIIQTRILSVVLWYHLAFFVISMAMFGLTLGAVYIYLRGDRYTEETLSDDLAKLSAAFALSTAVSLGVQMTLAPVSGISVTALVIWVELAMCLFVPFFFSGAAVSLALTRSPFPIGIVYGVDLAGAAFGCICVLALLSFADGPSAVLYIASLAGISAVFFSNSEIGKASSGSRFLSMLVEWKYALVFLLMLVAIINNSVLDTIKLRPIVTKDRIELPTQPLLFEDWNSFSRIGVEQGRSYKFPRLWGASPTFKGLDEPLGVRYVHIDGLAGTPSYEVKGDLSRAEFLKYDVTNLAYYLPNLDNAAVVGVGAGRDLLSARVFGVSTVTGVEINPIFIDLLNPSHPLADYSGIGSLAGVSFEVDEARSWFARSNESFDMIQMSLIDTWAATGAGAYTLTENGLYTVEAWNIFLRRLTEDGVFTVSRWYAPGNVNETGRMVSLAVATLMSRNVDDPAEHVYLVASDQVANMLISISPFSDATLETLERITRELQYDVLISPAETPKHDVLANIIGSNSLQELNDYTSALSLDLTPPTDNRPFFFNQLPLSNIGKVLELSTSARAAQAGVVNGNLYAVLTLLVLFVISLMFVLITIIVPLRSAIVAAGHKLAWSGTAYFVLIGIGFMMIEIGLLQRLSVFLGHPVYSLSIVLFSMILFTGIGSMISEFFTLNKPGRIVLWSIATVAYLISVTMWLSGILLSFDSASLVVRAAVCTILIAPAGLLMGYGFPTGMHLVSPVYDRQKPWFWGINGASGVLASAFAVTCSIAYGIDVTIIIGALCYLLLIPAALTLSTASKYAKIGPDRVLK